MGVSLFFMVEYYLNLNLLSKFKRNNRRMKVGNYLKNYILVLMPIGINKLVYILH